MAWIIIFAATAGANLTAAAFAAGRGRWFWFGFNGALALGMAYNTLKAVMRYERDFAEFIERASDN